MTSDAINTFIPQTEVTKISVFNRIKKSIRPMITLVKRTFKTNVKNDA